MCVGAHMHAPVYIYTCINIHTHTYTLYIMCICIYYIYTHTQTSICFKKMLYPLGFPSFKPREGVWYHLKISRRK